MATLNIALINRSPTDTVYAYVTGLQIDNGNRRFLLQADGKSVYTPASPSSTGAALTVDVAIPLATRGQTKTVTIPHTAGGRIYFSYNSKLTFHVNPGPALVEPSVTNSADPNINILWGFAEFTWNSAQIYANITYVDFVSIPIALHLTNTAGQEKTITGIPANGLDAIATLLTRQNQSDGKGWDRLIYRNTSGQMVRILSPNQGMVMNSNLFKGYYEPYVNEVWTHYGHLHLTVNINPPLTGTVNNGQFVFNNDNNLRFGKPSTGDIFSSNSGPFTTGSNVTRNNIIPVLAAEFNRSTLMKTKNLPAPASLDYKETITNHYGRLVHRVNVDGKGYTQPYDDVPPSSGADASGFVNDPHPRLLTMVIGGAQYANASTVEDRVENFAIASNGDAHEQQPLQQATDQQPLQQSAVQEPQQQATAQRDGPVQDKSAPSTSVGDTSDGQSKPKKLSLMKRLRARVKRLL